MEGDQWAYTAGIVAIALGATLVFFMFPRKAHARKSCSRNTTRSDTASAAVAGPDGRASGAAALGGLTVEQADAG